MNRSRLEEASSLSMEEQFARVLENYRAGGSSDPFEVTQNFTSISAARALQISRKLAEDSNSLAEDEQEFVSWDLETKLWHLVTVLYSFRLSEIPDSPKPPVYASLSLKERDFLDRNPQLHELVLIIQWIQHNSKDVQVPDLSLQLGKWANTKVAIQAEELAPMASGSMLLCSVKHLDADAPLRSASNVCAEDKKVDAINYTTLYNYLLAGDYSSAIDFATQTSNFTLALIILGADQGYFDPVIDGRLQGDDDYESESTQRAAGAKHKYLWLQTVQKLAQSDPLCPEERLIYTFLAGSDQTENIKAATGSWETCLLLYVNQLLTHHFHSFMKAESESSESMDKTLPGVNFPAPQHHSVDGILNTLLRSSLLSAESSNPFRVIMGSIIINQLMFFLENTFKSTSTELLRDQHIFRVLAHLAVVASILDLGQGSKTPTKIIAKYISILSDNDCEDLVPIYLSFIPNEKDVRECYSVFLTSITDAEKRARQLDQFRRIELPGISGDLTPMSSATEDIGDENEYKIQNVLKRTVERVLAETEEDYAVPEEIRIQELNCSPVDVKLYRAVDWFYENNMYEDAIDATRTVVRRFLTTGRLKAFKEFGAGKSFKSLLKSHDLLMHTRSFGNATPPSLVTEAAKDELLQYEEILSCLNLLEEWNLFLADSSEKSWKSKDVENSIEKTIKKIHHFIFSWFHEAIETLKDESLREMYKEYRSIYVPFFIIELLKILQHSRLHDWKYVRSALHLVNEVANDKENDFLECFVSCGRISEFVTLAGEVAAIACERGTKGIYV